MAASENAEFDFNSEEEALGLNDPDFESIPKEQRVECLEFLQSEIKKDWLTPGEYGRFMKARNFDKKASLKMLQGHVEFRERVNYENISFEDCTEVLGDGYVTIQGCDRQGNPILYLDAEKFKTKWTVEQYETALAFCFRECLEKAEKGRMTVFFDLQNYSVWSQFSPMLTKTLATLGTQTFAEIIGNGMLYQAPFGFETVYNIAAMIMDARTTKRVSWHKDEKSILELIDEDNLLERYGGKMKLQKDSEKTAETRETTNDPDKADAAPAELK